MLLALQEWFVKSQLLLERQQLVLEHPRFHGFAHDVVLDSMLLVPLALTQLALVDLAVEELVVDLLIGPTLKSTMTMIKVLLMKMYLSHLRVMMKPASTFYRLRFLIETKLPITCSLMIVTVRRYLQSEKIQMLHMPSIALYVEGNIALKIVPP